jgi:hypothetical protein
VLLGVEGGAGHLTELGTAVCFLYLGIVTCGVISHPLGILMTKCPHTCPGESRVVSMENVAHRSSPLGAEWQHLDPARTFPLKLIAWSFQLQ